MTSLCFVLFSLEKLHKEGDSVCNGTDEPECKQVVDTCKRKADTESNKQVQNSNNI